MIAKPNLLSQTSPSARLKSDGVCSIAAVFSAAQCAQIVQALSANESKANNLSNNARNMLDQTWCQELAAQCATHPQLQPLLPANGRAIQCNYFEKTVANN